MFGQQSSPDSQSGNYWTTLADWPEYKLTSCNTLILLLLYDQHNDADEVVTHLVAQIISILMVL
jgi:hypothetical protein